MMLNLFLLLGLTGLVPVSVSIMRTVPHKYEAIVTQMTWPEARIYCRLNYTDVATILSGTDWLQVNKETAGLPPPYWTGLHKDFYGWRWVLNKLPLKNVTFNNWFPGQPDNYGGNEMCGIIAANNQWYDVQCTLIRPFVCYNGNFSGAAMFIGVSNPMLTWPDARAYCQTHHTDLASSLNSTDNDVLQQIKISQGDSWIGLHRDIDIWKWSDGTRASNIPWASGQPDNYYGIENCASLYNEQFYDERCSNLHSFFCHTIFPTRRQTVRVQVKSYGSVYDPAVQSSILHQIEQKLEEKGMLENTTVTWRVQPDGNIFHKKKT